MIRIAEVTAINQTKSSRRAIAMARNRGYNHLPVFHRNISNIIGIVTITTWDMMDADLLEKPLRHRDNHHGRYDRGGGGRDRCGL